jgi:gliding motility-associated-like protein
MRLKGIIILITAFLIGALPVAFSQDFTNKGNDFYITFPAHVDGTLAAMGIYITSDVAATGQVQVGNGGPVVNFSIAANTVRRIFLGSSPANDAPNGGVYQDQLDGVKSGSAIRVTSNQPVVVYAHIIRSARSGSSLILPTNTWGREYVVPSYWSAGASGATSGRGVITVVAKEANTVVEIVPSAPSFNGGRPTNVPFTINLPNPGDVYQVQFQKDADISGTIVRSVATTEAGCKPIAVFSATTWSAFNCSNASGGDNLYQQLFPTRAFGRTFLTAPFANRQRDIIRVFTVTPGTTISKTEAGATVNLPIGPAGFAEFETNNPTRIVANNPISVVQYMNAQTCDTRNPLGCANNGSCPWPADPEMVILNPVEQTINNITVFSAHQNWVPIGQSNVNQCFLNIIIPTPATGSFRINNNLPAGNFTAIPGTGFSYLQENISTLALGNPVQQLTADSSFSCIAYGYGNVESYGYNAGTNIRDLFQFLTIRDPNQSLDNSNACQLTPSKLFLTIPYPATKLVWNFNGLFPNVTINNPVADSIYLKEGKTLYRFPLAGEYNFQNVGANKLTILATNPTSDGCAGELQIDFEIVVRSKPISNFNFNFSSCVSDSARFMSTGSITEVNESVTGWRWNFGDNTNSSLNNPAHKFANSGTFNVAHNVISNFGCVSDTVKKEVIVNTRPIAAFNIAGPICQNQEFNIANTSNTQTGSINRWFWNMGNGQVFDRNSGAPFSYSYPNTGNYIVKLVVLTDGGCVSDTVQQNITVGFVPKSDFTIPDVCLNDAFANFTNTTTIGDGTIGQATWLWNYGNPNANVGNPNTNTLVNGRHNYNIEGNYQVKLVATSNFGCKDSLTQTLTVNGGNPTAAFNILNTGNICSNQAVNIQNKSTVNFGRVTRMVIYWDWQINNNDTTIDAAPLFDRTFTKNYPVFSSPAFRDVQIRMLAFSGDVCVNEIIKTVRLQAVPVARVNVIPGICLDANPIQITQGYDEGGNPGTGIYSGPGISPTGLFNPQIAGAGTHTIRFKFVSDGGCSDSTTATITVWPQPTANFNFSTATCLNAPITFTNTSVANANTIVSWNWDFGDGQTEIRTNGNNFTRTYSNIQNYNVTLQVTTDSGCVSNVVSKSITIHPLPVADFDLPTRVCLPAGRAAFTNTSTVGGTGGTPMTYLWNFGIAGATSTDVNPVFNYSSTGPFTVSLRATSARGCVDSANQQLSEIYAQLISNFSATPPEVCIGETIEFTDLSNPLGNTITSWSWSFGDGGTSALQNPSRVFANAGTYTVRMFYNTNIGCPSDTAIKTVIIHPYPVADAGPDQVVLQGGEVLLRGSVTGSSNYQFLWSPSTWLNNASILQPLSRAEDDITYTLTVTAAGGCSDFDTVFVRRLLKPIIPNVFSPNGDGINDFWIIKHLDAYPGATVQIFDRYGKAILKSTGYNTPWDGNNAGKPLPAGVYYYIIDPKNGLKPLTGSVTILR